MKKFYVLRSLDHAITLVRLSKQRPGFNITPFHVRLVTDELALGQVFLTYLSFPPLFFSWRYTTHSGCVFYSPLSGFSLLAYEVT